MTKAKKTESQILGSGSIFSKYLSIIVPVVLLLFLIIGIAVFNYFASSIQSQTTTTLNLVARQTELTQEIAKDVMSLHLQIVTPNNGYSELSAEESLSMAVDKLDHSTKIFDQTLNGLIKGGVVTNVDGKSIRISPVKIDSARYDLENIERMWTPFKQLTEAFSESVHDKKVDKEAIFFASDYAQLFEGRLYNELSDLNTILADKSVRQTRLAQIVNGVALLVAFIFFFYIVLIALRRLFRSDSELAEARRETTDIMQTIQEGLFLIDEKLHIGQQTSEKLTQIIPGYAFHGQQLEKILKSLVDSNEVENTRRFINQLFNERIDEQLIQDLNPLQRVVIRVEQDNDIELRYVRFIFTRVWEKDSIKRVLVSVTDITDAVRLEQKLEKERLQNEQQVELLMKILQISPPLLASFLRNARHLTERVNSVLRRRGSNVSDLKNKAREIFRDVHGFKGEASALGLESFVDNCETIEDRLKGLQNKPQITGNDFMQVTISLNDLIDRITVIENMQANIQQISDDPSGSLVREIEQYYIHFAENVAERNHKSVELEITAYEIEGMSEDEHDQIKEIIVQLIRNAIVHGIESPATRRSLDKDLIGHLRLSLKREGSGYRLNFADDGAGIDYVALRAKVRQMPKYVTQPEVVDNMDEQELNRFIFVSGISTAAKSNSDAGRGVGMDVIKDRLQALDGKIALKSQPEVGTEFVVRIP